MQAATVKPLSTPITNAQGVCGHPAPSTNSSNWWRRGRTKGCLKSSPPIPHKVYFDVDCHGLDRNLASTCTQHVLATFPNASMAVSGSFHKEKTSLHIVLQNYVIANDTDREWVKQLVKSWGSPWDWKVYTSNRNMKCTCQPDQAAQ